MDDKLAIACQMFLIPATILAAALAAATTEALKSLLCFMGVVVAGAWIYRLYWWDKLTAADAHAAYALAILFLVASAVAGAVHLRLWYKKELEGKGWTAIFDPLK
jgi:hypothetical protein